MCSGNNKESSATLHGVLVINLVINAWYPLKGHRYLKKPTVESFR